MVIICDEDRLLTWLFSSKEQQIPPSKTHKALRAALLELLLAVVLLLLLLPELERVAECLLRREEVDLLRLRRAERERAWRAVDLQAMH